MYEIGVRQGIELVLGARNAIYDLCALEGAKR